MQNNKKTVFNRTIVIRFYSTPYHFFRFLIRGQLSSSIKGNPSLVCQPHLYFFREIFLLWLCHENSPEKECGVKRPEGLLPDYRDKLRPT